MKKILFALFASLLVLGACGNQDETEKASEKKPSKSTVENKKKIKKKSQLRKNSHLLRLKRTNYQIRIQTMAGQKTKQILTLKANRILITMILIQ